MNSSQKMIEQWDFFELILSGPASDNPFVDTTLSAIFTQDTRAVKTNGFYDGVGTYRIRFMPETPGDWAYITQSNAAELDGIKGVFNCVGASPDNHGPVRVSDTYHFAYADGTPHISIGTTCYAWIHQGKALETQTLKTLAQSPFNKLRMCVFPKHYAYNTNEPDLFPFQRAPNGEWDFTRFNPAFFRHLEQRVQELCDLGIEADIILFHPYDKGHWGFDQMAPDEDDRYLRYIVARLAAFRNVWWSMANEYDLFENKSLADWDRFFQIVQEHDPYQHLRSIHNWHVHYDHSQPWVTHASIQTLVEYPDLEKVADWRDDYQKPVVVDETCYEGNIPFRWGFITPQEMVHRFWLGTVLGGYVGHGETYLHPDDILWWSKGGVLHGESPARIAFLKQILEDSPPGGLTQNQTLTRNLRCAGKGNDYFLAYMGNGQPALAEIDLPTGYSYQADIIDAWNMTITPVEGVLSGSCRIDLPGKPYIAVRLRGV